MKYFLRYLTVALGLCLLPAAANATCGTGVGTCFVVSAGGAWVSGTFSATSGGVSCACTPAAGDALILDSAAGNLTSVVGNPSLASLDASGTGGSGSPYTGTFTHTASQTVTITGNLFKLVSGMGYTASAATSLFSFTSTSGTTAITTGGKSPNFIFNGSGGTFQFQDDVTAGAGGITLTAGTIDDATNNKNVTTPLFSSNNSNTRIVQIGTSTWKITGANTVWDFTTTSGLTCTCSNGILWFSNTNASATQQSINLGGLTSYGTITFGPSTNAGSVYAVTGANTIATLQATAPAYVIWPSATVQTITNQFTLNGSSGSYISFLCTKVATCTIHASASGSSLSWASLYGMIFNTNSVNATNSFDLGNNNMGGGSITAPSGGGGGHIIGG